LCELLEWKRPNGKLKYKECRTLLERLQAEGLASLPALRKTAPCRPRTVASNTQGNPQKPLTGSVGEYLPLLLRLVQGTDLSSLWNHFIDRYHYLRFRVPFGANLRYLVESELHPGRHLACLLFSSPAWKMAARDAWIGWTKDERRRNLQYVVSNSRFLILPWVSIRGLASKILSLVTRRLPGDWERLYGYRPLLLETLVDPSRFRGTCYRAANWIYLGKTQGRGRMDRNHEAHGRAVKDLYVFPLRRDARRRLGEAEPPKPRESPEFEEPVNVNLLEAATRVELPQAAAVAGTVSVIDWQLLQERLLPERPEQSSARRARRKGRRLDRGS
jgi:Druantia protein DruA